MNYRPLTILAIFIFVLTSCTQKSGSTDVFKWNFSNFKKLKYKFTQITKNENSFIQTGNEFMKAEGTLVIAVKESGKADLTFNDIKTGSYQISESGDTSTTNTFSIPDFFIQDMDEFGNVDGKLDQQTQLLSELLFPVTGENMNVGEHIELPQSMPFTAFGSVLTIKGVNDVTLNSLENGIANFSTLIDVSDFTVPEDADINYNCYLKGSSKYDFNMDKGYFNTANLDITMFIGSSKKDLEETDSISNDSRNIENFDENMSMKTNTLIQLELKGVE